MNIFSSEGKLLQWLNFFCDLVTVNLLWIVCSLPVATIGASTTAMYQVLLHMADRQEPAIASEFFSAFRENFRQATVVWFMVLLTVLLFLADFFVIANIPGAEGMAILMYPLLILLFLLFGCSCWFYPVMAFFKNSTKKLLTNSFRLCCGYFLTTLQLVLLSCGPVFLLLCSRNNLVLGTFLLLILGFSMFAYLQAMLLLRIFRKHSEKANQL